MREALRSQIPQGLKAILRTWDFSVREMGHQGRDFSRGVKRSDAHFEKVVLISKLRVY